MKIYVITVSDVYNCEEYGHDPIVRLNKKEAIKKFNELVRSAKDCYEGIYNKTEYTKNSSFSFYEDGRHSTNHYDVALHEVDLGPGYTLDVLFGKTAVSAVEEEGFDATCLKLADGTIDGGASDEYVFDTEADRKTAARMLQDADGWDAFYCRFVQQKEMKDE